MDCEDAGGLSQQFDESEIFNDVLPGGGVEPSINDNDTLRDSIKCSFVSSEAGGDQQTDLAGAQSVLNSNKSDTYVMNRMNWIMHLKILFDELESFT